MGDWRGRRTCSKCSRKNGQVELMAANLQKSWKAYAIPLAGVPCWRLGVLGRGIGAGAVVGQAGRADSHSMEGEDVRVVRADCGRSRLHDDSKTRRGPQSRT